MRQFSLRNLLVLVACTCLVVSLIVVRTQHAKTSAELARIKRLWNTDAEVECIDVVIKTSWLEAPQELWLSVGSEQSDFTISVSASGIENDETAVSFSVCYAGKVMLRNGFERNPPDTEGHLIAVQVSYFDQTRNETTDSQVAYVLYTGQETVAYQNASVSVTIKPQGD